MINTRPLAYVLDAYGTLCDVHAAIARHRGEAGPDAGRFSEIWRAKRLEYTGTLTLAGRYLDFWTLAERALDYAFARTAQPPAEETGGEFTRRDRASPPSRDS